jgi:hypothetical protein
LRVFKVYKVDSIKSQEKYMRELTNVEANIIGAGLYCTDKEGMKKIAWQAVADGMLAGGFSAAFLGAAVYAGSTYVTDPNAWTPVLAGAGMSLVTALPLVGYFTYHSNAWNILN